MGQKYFYFLKSSPIEELYEKTLNFWQKNKGNIEEETLSSDKLIKTLKIHRGMTLTSNGEDYIIDFSHNLKDSSTYIRIEASLVLGYGIQWLTPKKLINKWVSELRITPTYLVGRTNEEFFDFDKIQRRRPLYIEKPKSITQLKIESQPKFESQPKPAPQPEKITISQPSVKIKPPESSTITSKTVPKKEFDRFDEFAVRFCTFCGVKNKKTFNFCKNCGRKLE